MKDQKSVPTASTANPEHNTPTPAGADFSGQYFTRVSDKYTFRVTQPNHFTRKGIPANDRLSPRPGC
ncbi:MAG: hypothetical protein ACQETO_00380 [Pseudomonadota bacterium]